MRYTGLRRSREFESNGQETGYTNSSPTEQYRKQGTETWPLDTL